jgi:hypothetical protein
MRSGDLQSSQPAALVIANRVYNLIPKQKVVIEIIIALQTITLDAMSSVSVEVAMIRFEPARPTDDKQDQFDGRNDRWKVGLGCIKARSSGQTVKAPISITFSFVTLRIQMRGLRNAVRGVIIVNGKDPDSPCKQYSWLFMAFVAAVPTSAVVLG